MYQRNVPARLWCISLVHFPRRSEIGPARTSGVPTCVHAAELELVFSDGSAEVRAISYAPNGVMYEVFDDQVNAPKEADR